MSKLKVAALQGLSASSDAITLANDGTCTANITNNLSNRNKVINGSMICSQRGTSFSPDNTEQPYTLDRFQHVATGGADGDCTITQSTDAPAEFKNSYKITPDATNTPTGGGNVTIRHKIEGQNLQDLAYGTSSAKSLTISFYAKTASANSGDQYTLCLFYARQDSTQKTVTRSFTPTSTYQRFSFTIAGDTDASYGIRDDNGTGMTITWVLASGPNDITGEKTTWEVDGGLFRGVTGQSNFMDNTSNEFYLTGVQLEVDHTGSGVATDFEHRSFGQELALCQRYYQVLVEGGSKSICLALSFTGNNGFGFIDLKTEMRAAPTLDVVTGTAYWRAFRNGGTGDFNDVIMENNSNKIVGLKFQGVTSGTSLASQEVGFMRSNNSAAFLAASSEL